MTFVDKIFFKYFKFQTTYSQCGEDVILSHIFNSLKIDKVQYLDIGANHPQMASNTYLFYKNGGQGVCVEPNPSLHSQIKAKRKRDVCLNAGIATNGQSELDFYIMDVHTLSTFSKQDAESLAKEGAYKIQEVVKVPVLTINEVLGKYFTVKNIDLVSLDVEGLNEEIVESLDLIKFRPKVLCIETLTFSSGNLGSKITPITEKLLANGYYPYADTYLNTIFIDKAVWK